MLPDARPPRLSWLAACVLACSPAVVRAGSDGLDGHKVVRIRLADTEQLDVLSGLTDDIWSHDVGIGPVDVRLTPDQFAQLQASGLSFDVLIDDIGPLARATMLVPEGAGFFDAYHPLADILAQVDQYAVDFPALATIVEFGTSIEGRPLRGVRITGAGSGDDKPGFLINAGLHAREWVNIPVALYIAEWLLNNYGTDPTVTRLVDDVDWYILPCMNPDGYEWSWTNQRLWRKNRRNNGDGTVGVDLNRNFDFEWGGPGSSGNTWEDIYRGPAPFSEPETRAVRDFVLTHRNIAAYIDYHSYSQLIIWPWGHNAQPPPDQAEYVTVVSDIAAAIFNVHGQAYIHGSSYTTLYPATGTSDDWVYGANLDDRIILAMTVELRDTGTFGFLLPPEQILPTCEENLPAALHLADWISRLGPALRVEIVSEVSSLVPPAEAFSVTARIRERWGAFAGENVSTFYRVVGGPYVETPMTPLGDDLYGATIPPVGCDQNVEFFVQAASDAGSSVNRPTEAPAQVLAYTVATPIPVLVDDFETAAGWNVGDTNDDATTGIWARVDPRGTLAQPEDDQSADPGVMCFVTGQGSVGGLIGENDVDGGRTTLFSPVLDLSGGDARIGYWRWYSNTRGGNPAADVFHVDITADAGQSWVNVETVGPAGPEAVGGWFHHEFTVSDFISSTAHVQVRFVASDEGGGSIIEAAIDDFTVVRMECASASISVASRSGLAVTFMLLGGAGIIMIRRRSVLVARAV